MYAYMSLFSWSTVELYEIESSTTHFKDGETEALRKHLPRSQRGKLGFELRVLHLRESLGLKTDFRKEALCTLSQHPLPTHTHTHTPLLPPCQ